MKGSRMVCGNSGLPGWKMNFDEQDGGMLVTFEVTRPERRRKPTRFIETRNFRLDYGIDKLLDLGLKVEKRTPKVVYSRLKALGYVWDRYRLIWDEV